MSISANNISVPTINYAVSGSQSLPITQGAFQSELSVLTNDSGIYLYPGSPQPFTPTHLSAHIYLKLNIGTVGELRDPDTGVSNANGYTGIYCKGTVLKPGSSTTEVSSLQRGIAFEHFGTFKYPWGFTYELPEKMANNMYSEFVLKSQTWNVDNNQAVSNLSPFIQNNGLETATNWTQDGPGLQYIFDANFGGQGNVDNNIYNQNSIFPMFVTIPGFDDSDSVAVTNSKSVFINCGINFYGNSPADVTGFIVKGTYLLV